MKIKKCRIKDNEEINKSKRLKKDKNKVSQIYIKKHRS